MHLQSWWCTKHGCAVVQGDVGCGKTVVAFLASLLARADGYQTAMMCPTEVLADQHVRNFELQFASLPEVQLESCHFPGHAAVIAVQISWPRHLSCASQLALSAKAPAAARVQSDTPCGLQEQRPRVAMLGRGTKQKERQVLLRELASGQVHLLIGTHALIEDAVRFLRLGLIIIDEQHKCGSLCIWHVLVSDCAPSQTSHTPAVRA